MPDETPSQTFPATKQDINNLKQTTGEAAREIGDTAANHANKLKQNVGEAARDVSDTAAKHLDKAKGQAKDLARHAKEEGAQQLEKVKGSFNDVVEAASGYVQERPLQCVAGALFVGFLFGLSRRSR
jgi:ElaB/YqjD/DUF883 family membrane-anchored ribosome-binding protein